MTADAGAPGAPRFDVVLRGYDRRQVDEHVARLQRALARMRADLDVARSQPFPVVPSPAAGFPLGQQSPAAGPPGPTGGRPRPTPRPRPGLPAPPVENPDMIGTFTDRMQSILQAAEEEAAEIRNKARSDARAEAEAARGDVTEILRQRDAVLADLTRMRSQLEGLLSSPTARFARPSGDGSARTAQPWDAGHGEARPGSGQPASPRPSAGQPVPAQPTGSRPGPVPPAQAGPTPPRDASGSSAGHDRSLPTAGGADQRSGSSANGSGQAGVPSPGSEAPASSTKGGATAPDRTEPPRKAAAHRLPTGAYPAVPEKPASMRPRTEPEPEPGELFRPLTDAASSSAVEPHGPDDDSGRDEPTVAAPTVRPDQEPPTPPQAGAVEATVQVGAVRPTSSDDTVLTSAVTPSTERGDEKGGDTAPEGESGGNGSGSANRPTSPSRSG